MDKIQGKMYNLRKQTYSYKTDATIITKEDILKFLREADDDLYLQPKVVAIIALNCGPVCTVKNLQNLHETHVIDNGGHIAFHFPHTHRKIMKIFPIGEGGLSGVNYLHIIRKYIDLRPAVNSHLNFLTKSNFKMRLCFRVSKLYLCKLPTIIADFLGFPNPQMYQCSNQNSTVIFPACINIVQKTNATASSVNNQTMKMLPETTEHFVVYSDLNDVSVKHVKNAEPGFIESYFPVNKSNARKTYSKTVDLANMNITYEKSKKLIVESINDNEVSLKNSSSTNDLMVETLHNATKCIDLPDTKEYHDNCLQNSILCLEPVENTSPLSCAKKVTNKNIKKTTALNQNINRNIQYALSLKNSNLQKSYNKKTTPLDEEINRNNELVLGVKKCVEQKSYSKKAKTVNKICKNARSKKSVTETSIFNSKSLGNIVINSQKIPLIPGVSIVNCKNCTINMIE